MQQPFHPLFLAAVVFALASSATCYPHAGQPVEADSDQWINHAERACQRGDQAAFETLIERADAGEHLRCKQRTVVQTTTPEDAD